MLQFCHRARFPQEPLHEVFLLGQLFGKRFHGDFAIKADLLRQIDLTHSPLAQFFDELKIAEPRGLFLWRTRLRLFRGRLGRFVFRSAVCCGLIGNEGGVEIAAGHLAGICRCPWLLRGCAFRRSV